MILIVDDVPANISVLSGILKDKYKIKVATGGEKALEIAHSDDKPSLILLDIMMPEMDGYEVCRRLKSDVDTRDIPVIFLTGMDTTLDEAKGLMLGANDFIFKPIDPIQLNARLRVHLVLEDRWKEREETLLRRIKELELENARLQAK